MPQPSTIFRIGGLLACANVALPLLVRDATLNDEATLLRVALDVGLALVFGAAFWLNTGPGARSNRGRARVLFALQVAIAVAVTDYFFIVAATAPLVFSPRGALVWIAVQLTIFLGVALALVSLGMDVAIPEVAGAPRTAAVAASIVYVALWQVFAFTIGYLAAGERRSHEALERGTRHLLATQRMLAENSRAAERAQISRDLHDSLGHSLTVLNVNLELAAHLTAGRAADAIVRAQTVGRMLLADVREVVHSLRDDSPIDLAGAIRALADGAHAPVVHVAVPDDLHVADPLKAHAIFRCVQEAVTNAARHAQARQMWVALRRHDDRLELRVHDDGVGTREVWEGHGLQGMRERLSAVGGALQIRTSPGQGFALDVSMPC